MASVGIGEKNYSIQVSSCIHVADCTITRLYRDSFQHWKQTVAVLGCSLLCLLDNGPVSHEFLSGFCKPFEELDITSIAYMSPACLLKVQDSCNQCSRGAGKATSCNALYCLSPYKPPFFVLQLKPRDSDICHCLDQCPLPEGT